MRKTTALTAMAMFVTLPSMVVAQTPTQEQLAEVKKSHHIVDITPSNPIDTATQQDLLDIFYQDQYRHFQDPLAPYFMLMSRTNQVAMGVGGAVRAHGWMDWNGTMPSSGFTPYNIAIPSSPTQRRWFGTNVGTTSLFVTVFGHSERFGNYQLYIRGNFNGAGGTVFQLKKAYATVGDWTLGYANSTFTDPSAQPPTVDNQGPNAETGDTNVLLRWMHKVKENYVVAASVETPGSQIPGLAGFYEPCADYVPRASAFVQYQWAGGTQHIRLSGLVRGMKYRNMIEQANHSVVGWGAHLSAVFNPVAPLTVYGAAIGGKGIGSLINDLQNAPMDLVAVPGHAGQLDAPMSFGWYGALQYNYRPDLFSTIMFSQERFMPQNQPTVGNSTYKYGIYATANVFWNITPRCQAGVEYNGGERMNFDGQHGRVNRVSAIAQFSF